MPPFAQNAPPEAVKELAPTGKLRAAINYGNGVLAQKGADGEPRGVSADLARELAKRLGVPLEFVTFDGRRQGVRGREGEQDRRPVRRDRAGARRRGRVHAALCADRRRVSGGEGFAAARARRSRQARHAHRGRREFGLRPLPHAHAEECDAAAHRGRLLQEHRAVPRREARRRGRRAPAARRVCERACRRARDGEGLPADPPGDGRRRKAGPRPPPTCAPSSRT